MNKIMNPNIEDFKFQNFIDFDDENKEQFEIDVKPKQKQFENYEEKQKYINQYKQKIKTELCKNWQLKGSCKFGDDCSFAHGKEQLKLKTHLHENFKSRPCKSYFQKGFCSYGYRCQYLHDDVKFRPQIQLKFKNIITSTHSETSNFFQQKLQTYKTFKDISQVHQYNFFCNQKLKTSNF